MGGLMIRNFPRWTLAAAAFMGVQSLGGCANFPNAPDHVAQSTKLDERLGVSAELAYTTATKLGTVLARAGLIDTAKFKRLDNEAYTALLAVRDAYKAGNASNYAEAVVRVQSAIMAINGLAKD